MGERAKKMGRPATPLYRKRKVRFAYLEDAFLRVMEKVEDPQALEVIQRELKTLVSYEKMLSEEREKKGKDWY